MVYGINYWSHHQAPVALALSQILGPDHFRMALFEDVHSERRNMGWNEVSAYPWVMGPPRNEAERKNLYEACIEADVLVGSFPREVLCSRVASGKLTFVASERLLKKPWHRLRLLNPRYACGFARYRTDVNHPNVHALAIGHYAPSDLQVVGVFGERVWQWGYFVDVSSTPPPPRQDGPVKILWVGRMLGWKRVDTLIEAFSSLCSRFPGASLTLVGDGPERNRLHRLCRRSHLNEEKVRFCSSVPFAEVRQLMRDADIYVLPSNRHEGWGAVAGEAMSEGCVLVANEAAGSAQVLVRHGETGLLFRDGDAVHLSHQLGKLLVDHSFRMRLRQSAFNQMQELWHPRVAAERLVSLCSGFLGQSELPLFTSGPCSKVTGVSI